MSKLALAVVPVGLVLLAGSGRAAGGGDLALGVFYQAPDPPSFPVASGKSYSWVNTTDFGCNANRRWRFELRRSDGNQAMLYYPSSTTFSDDTTVDLGDLGRSSLW